MKKKTSLSNDNPIRIRKNKLSLSLLQVNGQ